ncbi:hypothetical protein [Motilibacter deserti]|uniref:Serine hydroxymethyltransferase-like domain-containing protein n=1 Tax=Motilibacter deserti TaxID=2714956 RepID=A0ABX0GZ02_9ACTN|nr:hypothetical protein [Motilibacter deserti]NHC16042.1 hypothetical protein [Motilibacter deserti]
MTTAPISRATGLSPLPALRPASSPAAPADDGPTTPTAPGGVLAAARHSGSGTAPGSPLTAFAAASSELLADEDPWLHGLLHAEHVGHEATLSLRAGSGAADPSVLACLSAAGVQGAAADDTDDADDLEQLAVERARTLFGARYATVRPGGAAQATVVALAAVLGPGDEVLHVGPVDGADLPGTPAAPLRCAPAADGGLDYARVATLLRRHRPRALLVQSAGLSRRVDHGRLRTLTDGAGAVLIADITAVAALVAAGTHPGPVDCAHLTVTGTRGQLAGPAGGLVLSGSDAELPFGAGTLAERVEHAARTACPEPARPALAATARALALAAAEPFAQTADRAVRGAGELAAVLSECGHSVVGGRTDTSTVVLDPAAAGIDARTAASVLAGLGILVDVTRLPGRLADRVHPDGLLLDTYAAAQRGLGPVELRQLARIIGGVLEALTPSHGAPRPRIGEPARRAAAARLDRMLTQFPLSRHVPVARIPADPG